MKKILTLAGGIVLAGSLAACGSSGTSSTHASSVASSIAANPSVQADEHAAALLVKNCVTVTHIAAFKTCLENQVPVPARGTLRKCLATAAAASVGKPDARKLFEAGAQACVQVALKGSASIPGFPASPSAS